MGKETEIQHLDSAIESDLIIDSNHNIIQMESTSNQIINNDPKSEKRKKKPIILIFFALQLSLFLSALDNTIVSTVLPVIGSDFNQMSIVSWVATAYILTIDAFQPLFAKFSDIFGCKWTLITGISIFLFGSLLCGVSTSIIMLIISRAISGIGGAGIIACVYIVISGIVPLEKRGNYQGVVDSVFALSGLLGPLLGGALTDNTTWRWCFYINIPTGGISILLLFFFLDLPTKKSSLMDKLKRIDYLGTLIVLTAGILFLLALNLGSSIYPWTSVAVLVPLILSLILIILFIIVESKFAKEPIVPLRLFKNRSVAGILFSNWWFGIGFLSFIYYIPIYLQIVKGNSSMWSGIRMLPAQVAICGSSSLTGFLITKFQFYRPIIWFGTSLFTLGVGLLLLFDVNTEYPIIYLICAIGGIGMGVLFPSTIIGLQASVEPKDIAVTIGLGNFSRLLGGTIGIAISSSVLNSELKKKLPTVLPLEYVDIVIEQALFIHHGLPDQYKSLTIQTYCDSFHFIWYVITPITALSIFASSFIQHHPLRKPIQNNNNDNDDNNDTNNDSNNNSYSSSHNNQHHQLSTDKINNNSIKGTQIEIDQIEKINDENSTNVNR